MHHACLSRHSTNSNVFAVFSSWLKLCHFHSHLWSIDKGNTPDLKNTCISKISEVSADNMEFWCCYWSPHSDFRNLSGSLENLSSTSSVLLRVLTSERTNERTFKFMNVELGQGSFKRFVKIEKNGIKEKLYIFKIYKEFKVKLLLKVVLNI